MRRGADNLTVPETLAALASLTGEHAARIRADLTMARVRMERQQADTGVLTPGWLALHARYEAAAGMR